MSSYINQFRFMVQGPMPKLDTINNISRLGEFTLFVGRIGTRNLAGIHIPKEAFQYGENNTTRRNIKHAIKKLFGDWVGFGDHHSVTIGWSNYPALTTLDTSKVRACTFTNGMTEFAALTALIRKVLEWPAHMQKAGWYEDQVDNWIDKQLKHEKRIEYVTRAPTWRSSGPAPCDVGSD